MLFWQHCAKSYGNMIRTKDMLYFLTADHNSRILYCFANKEF